MIAAAVAGHHSSGGRGLGRRHDVGSGRGAGNGLQSGCGAGHGGDTLPAPMRKCWAERMELVALMVLAQATITRTLVVCGDGRIVLVQSCVGC